MDLNNLMEERGKKNRRKVRRESSIRELFIYDFSGWKRKIGRFVMKKMWFALIRLMRKKPKEDNVPVTHNNILLNTDPAIIGFFRKSAIDALEERIVANEEVNKVNEKIK